MLLYYGTRQRAFTLARNAFCGLINLHKLNRLPCNKLAQSDSHHQCAKRTDFGEEKRTARYHLKYILAAKLFLLGETKRQLYYGDEKSLFLASSFSAGLL
jgi:hypothetical protein